MKDAKYYRDRRAKLRNRATDMQPVVAQPNATLTTDGEALLLALVGKYYALDRKCDEQQKRITLLEEVVAQLARNVDGLEKAQVKSVGLAVPRLAGVQLVNPLSKEAQSSLKAMPYLNRGDG